MTHLDSTWKFRLPQLPLGKDGLHSGSKGPIKKPHPRLIRHPSHHFFFFAGASNGLHTSNIYQHLKMLLDDLLISCKQPSSMNNHTHICNYIILIPLYICISLSLWFFAYGPLWLIKPERLMWSSASSATYDTCLGGLVPLSLF